MAKTALRNKLATLTVMAGVLSTAMAVTGSPTPQPAVITPSHYKAAKVTQTSIKGKELFEREHCASCHSVDSKGGCLAPPLDGIGAYRSQQFIMARITDSAAEIERFKRLHPGEELLQHPRLKAEQAHQVTSFLLTVPEPAAGFHIGKHKTNPGDNQKANEAANNQAASSQANAQNIIRGREQFMAHGCISCHSVNGLGGRFAPALDGESTRRERAFVEARITDAQFFTERFPDEYSERGLVMPPADLNSKDVKQITDFVMSLPALAPAPSDRDTKNENSIGR
jgi:nitric oxide reductase subunit C